MKKPRHAPAAPKLSPTWPGVLLALALAEAALAAFQWSQLLTIRAGGKAVCALSETVNCATVWNSAFASRVHALLGVPVAGLGLVWGLSAGALAGALWLRARRAEPVEVPAAAVKLLGLAGLLACVTFAVASFRSGAVCLTCLGTFGLVLAFAAVAFLRLPGRFPPPRARLQPALLQVALGVVAFHLVLLYPGLQTPAAHPTALAGQVGQERPRSRADAEQRVEAFFAGLSASERQRVADLHALFRHQLAKDVSGFATRATWGPSTAPMKLVDFTDLRCGHCRALEQVLTALQKTAPEGQLSIESRHYPLDQECNPQVPFSDGKGVRCLGAKAQICLEGAPDYQALRHQLFEHQESLTPERILEIASSGSVRREQLVSCIQSPETERKLKEDLAYAGLYVPSGTPLVLVNGKEANPSAAWLYAMALLGGDVDAPVWRKLPPARDLGPQGRR